MENDQPTIAEIAAGNPDFEVLTLALDAAGLTDAVADPAADLTVFAPTDAAFAALAADFGFEGDADDAQAVFDAIAGALGDLTEDGDPIPLLTDILLAHVAEGARDVATLQAGDGVATLEGTSLIPSAGAGIIDADPDAENPDFVEGLTDIPAANGTVQAIDGVILPFDLEGPEPEATLAGTLVAVSSDEGFDDDAGDFDILLAALEAAGLTDALDDPDASLTAFAPTDAAFVELARTFGATPETEEAAFDAIVNVLTDLAEDANPIPLLTEILGYHVAQGALTRTDLAAGPEIDTLAEDAPEPGARGLADADGDVADPRFVDEATDLVAANGIAHAIDAVLLPLDVAQVVATGGPDDDVLNAGESTVLAEGGAGNDTLVFDEAFADVAFDVIDGGFAFDLGDRTVEATGVERFGFSDDTTLAVDEGEAAASVARLYEAALGQTYDPAGAAFWTGVVEGEGGVGLAVDAFAATDAFATRFDTTDADMFVDDLYAVLLGREADEAGAAFWTGALEAGAIDEGDVLGAFSESAEYAAITEDLTDDGVLLLDALA